MELVLWRHAEAEDDAGQGDPARRLTKHGRKQAETMAAWLDGRMKGDWRIVVSPARRTVETVNPLGRDFEESAEVGTGAGAAQLLRETGWPAAERHVLVVGHQPTLGEVAARLLGASQGIAVRKSAAWWFAARDGHMILRAVMDPDLLKE
jgi:phosphohistidine phosphatase